MKNTCAWGGCLKNRRCFRCRCVCDGRWKRPSGVFRAEISAVSWWAYSRTEPSSPPSAPASPSAQGQDNVSMHVNCLQGSTTSSSSLFPVQCSRHFYRFRFVDPLNIGYNVQLRAFFAHKLFYPLDRSVCNFLGTPQIVLQAGKDPQPL